MGTGLGDVSSGPHIQAASHPEAHTGSRAVPTTGMRGGLGRTLLTAFLILTILPIAVIGGYAAWQNRRNTEQEVGARLVAVAAFEGEALRRWVGGVTAELQIGMAGGRMPDRITSESECKHWWDEAVKSAGTTPFSGELTGCAVLDRTAGDNHTVTVLWATGACSHLEFEPQAVTFGLSQSVGAAGLGLVSRRSSAEAGQVVHPVPVLFLALPDQTLALCLEDSAFSSVLAGALSRTSLSIGETGRTSLIGSGVVWPDGEPTGWDWGAVTASDVAGPDYALYQKSDGEPVVGALYPMPEYGIGVLVEQAQAEVLAKTEQMAATLIAWILVVAFTTTWIAATVIRQITRPVIDLTESAVAMAEGDLEQRLPVRSRDEIGILTHVFNEMASELSSLYRDLEAKVVERTRRLQEANYQIQRRALHLQASQEVSQAITSVRDPELLLKQVTELVRNHFVYSSVAVYLADPGGVEARLYASSPDLSGFERATSEATGDSGPWALRYRAGDGSLVGRAIRKGTAQLDSQPVDAESSWSSRMLSRVAVPMKIAGLRTLDLDSLPPSDLDLEDRPDQDQARSRSGEPFGVVGVLAVVTTVHEGIQHDELHVLEALANQVTIALENARAYERERLAAEQLEMTEAFKARFLANMSHDLMEPLNTIVGFSRLLLKGIDGALNERQREDIDQIYTDGQRLHVLINDILSVSELEAGLVELRLQPVDLTELVVGLMPTADALVRGKPIVLNRDIPSDLPELHADPLRLRQVLVHLLNNAAKFTERGEIMLRAWENEGEVYVSVRDTGVGISVEDRTRLFMHFETIDGDGNGQRKRGAGLGLSLCKEYVELHGGHIWVDSEVGVGSAFTFSVPAYTSG